MNDASPRFRQDLEASATEADGVACVDVRDPQTGTNFRFYDFEYQLALQFNGQPLGTVVTWASEAYGVDLTVEGINEFAGRLSELGFLEAAADSSGSLDSTPALRMVWYSSDHCATVASTPSRRKRFTVEPSGTSFACTS